MPIRQENTFNNPEQKPIDQLHFPVTSDDGKKINVPALDKRWTSRQVFATYTSLIRSDGRLKNGVELEEWQYQADCFQEDMQYLLQRPHHVFWSYMVYQKAAIAAVISFLQHATPFYIDVKALEVTSPQISLYERILCQSLRIICRLITNKEAPDAWIRQEHLSELIYSNYLITVPMLFDLVIAIGDASTQNASILKRIFSTVLELEPKYKNDMLTALAFFRAAFRSIQTQADNEGFEGAGGGTLDECAETPYDDVALYTLDCAFSLSVLLEVCPLVRSLCAEINLGKSIAQFYDSTIVNLFKNICQINEEAVSISWLNQARIQYLAAFRHIAYSFVEAVLTNPEDCMQHVENFLALMTDCLSEQVFVIDYERQYPVALDIEILKQACPTMDEFKTAFVLQAYQQECEEEATRSYEGIQQITDSLENAKLYETRTNNSQMENGEMRSEIPADPATALVGPVERDIDLEVTAVLDILPHLGTGFIRRILSRYDNSDQAVAAILEENLPPDLVNADQNEPYIPPDPQDKLYKETGVQHFNIYDGDAYDVMVHDKPDCIIKRGKGFPNAPKNVTELLDDKSELTEIRHRYQAYSLVTEDDECDENAEYDDEYDDSYDALLESETRVVRSKELKAGLANVEDISEGDEDNETDNSENNEESDKRQQNKRMNFCENPEDVRARYEAKRQAKWVRRGGANTSEPKRDVVGAQKGQGQSSETIRNRQKKEANKSSRANHNRKAGASFKRSKGMIP